MFCTYLNVLLVVVVVVVVVVVAVESKAIVVTPLHHGVEILCLHLLSHGCSTILNTLFEEPCQLLIFKVDHVDRQVARPRH